MTFIAISLGLTLYLLIIVIFGASHKDKQAIDTRVSKLMKTTNRQRSVEEEELSRSVKDRLLKPLSKKVITRTTNLLPKENNEQLKASLVQGGINLTVDEFNAMRVIIFVTTAAVTFVYRYITTANMGNSLLWTLMIIVVDYFLITLYVRRRSQQRSDQINSQLPEVLDLLSVSVEAGLGFDQALKEVTSTFGGPLIDELNTVQREMQLGKTKRESLQDMAHRAKVEELSLFVSAVIQGEQFGISMKNILRTQSFAIRLRYKQRIEEKAAKLPVKIILPIAIFIFPVLFIVVLGPTLFNLLEAMTGF